MRQYIAVAALAALAAAQSGADLGMTGTNDEKASTIKGDWNETIDSDEKRDNYKVEEVTDYETGDDLID